MYKTFGCNLNCTAIVSRKLCLTQNGIVWTIFGFQCFCSPNITLLHQIRSYQIVPNRHPPPPSLSLSRKIQPSVQLPHLSCIHLKRSGNMCPKLSSSEVIRQLGVAMTELPLHIMPPTQLH